MRVTEKNEPKKALGYLRISDKKQIKGESLANQREAIRSYAYDKDIEVVDWFTDEAKSGKNADRQALQELIVKAAKMKGQIDYVLVYKMNRASRDIDSYVMVIKSQLSALGIRIQSVTEQFDDSPMGHFIENMHVMVGQLDNENKRETVIDNMTRLAKQGYWQHTPPRGYDICKIKNSEGKKRPSLTPNHEASKVKDLLMRWNRGDMSEAQLTRYAEAIKLCAMKSGKPLNQDVVHKMLINPVYAGDVCDKLTDNERVKGRHEALITPEVFEQNQLILLMRNKDYMSGLNRQIANETYPLRRFVRCTHCDKYMTAAAPHNSPRYYCARPSCKQSGSIMTKVLHPQFEELLTLITPTQGTRKLLKEILKRQVKQELGDINRSISNLRDRLDENDSYKQKVLAKFIADKLSEEQKDTALRGADKERVDLQSELLTLERKQTTSEDSIENALGFMGNINKYWHSAPLELKQAYQELVFPKGFVYDIKTRKFLTPEISPLYRLDLGELGAKNDENFVMVTPRRVELRLPG
jgi:site-specific DNA recombinase